MNRRALLGLSAAAMGVATLGVATQAIAEDTIEISGTYGYRERIALLPGTRGIVRIEDISRADGMAEILEEVIYDLTDQPTPIGYRLNVPADKFLDGHTYALRIQIRSESGALLWTSDTVNRVDPSLGDQRLDNITLVRAQSQMDDIDLTGTSWDIIEAQGLSVPEPSTPMLEFGADGRLSGNSGCNQLSGTYTQTGRVIALGPIASTRRACVPIIGEFEAAVLGALSSPVSILIQGETLRLTSQQGAVIILKKRHDM